MVYMGPRQGRGANTASWMSLAMRSWRLRGSCDVISVAVGVPRGTDRDLSGTERPLGRVGRYWR